MARKHYQVIVKFTYSDGSAGGVLDGIVTSKKGIEYMMDSNRKWLAIKGHKEESVEIKEVE